MEMRAKGCCPRVDCSKLLTLDRLAIGERCRVCSVGGERNTKRRLLEMGLCHGVEVQLVRRAPLGDPIELKVRGYLLSLRSEQARHVSVEVEDPRV